MIESEISVVLPRNRKNDSSIVIKLNNGQRRVSVQDDDEV